MTKRNLLLLTLAAIAAVIPALVQGAEPKPPRPWNFPAGNFPELFPFKIEKGNPQNITNVQTWGTPWSDAGNSPVSVQSGDYFQNGRPFRFMGTNLCFTANFCEKDDAVRLAETLARFGIRAVRLHHMDMYDIWGKNFERTKTEIDPEQLDKLDWLIAQLEQRGIYVDINLHVSRYLDERDGFENSAGYNNHCKGINLFEPRMIVLQEKYARDLLTHVNPYTKRPYTSDPGVAMVEINNENSVFASWFWGGMDQLGAPYDALFRRLWNDWLRQKYGATDKLLAAWQIVSSQDAESLGNDQIKPKSFPASLAELRAAEGWEFQSDETSRPAVMILPADEKNAGGNILKWTVKNAGSAAWLPQLYRTGIALKKGRAYTLSFEMRSDEPAECSVALAEDHADWNDLGFRQTVKSDGTRKTFRFDFVGAADEAKARLVFNGFSAGQTFELSNISLFAKSDLDLTPEKTLEAGTIPILRKDDESSFANECVKRDFYAFLIDLESSYWNRMYKFLKEDLGVQAPVSGTQLQYGSWYAQARLDYCDYHSYWQHPVLKGGSWQSECWTVNNVALVNDREGGTLSDIAVNRVAGRPLTVSEYDHPFPNLQGAEGNLMGAAFGAFQGWTGIFQFAWTHGTDFDPPAQANFFDMCGNPVKLVHLPACCALFSRGDVTTGPGKYAYIQDLTKSEEIGLTGKLDWYWNPLYNTLAKDKSLSLACWAGLNLTEEGKAVKLPPGVKNVASWSELPENLGSKSAKSITNEFGELRWNTELDAAGYFTVDTPGVKVFTGFVRNRAFDFNGLTLRPGTTRLDWATVSMTAAASNAPSAFKKGGKPALAPGRYLIAATGMVQNTGTVFVEVDDGLISTAPGHGGYIGEAPVLCEGVELELTLDSYAPEQVKIRALDSSGNPAASIPVQPDDRGCKIKLGPQYKTLWYEMTLSIDGKDGK